MREANWIAQILAGDRAAGERLVSQHYARLYRWLYGLTGRADVAEDLTQQTFVQAWRNLAGFRHESSLATWLHRIAYHEYIHWRRDTRPTLPLEAAAHLPAPPIAAEWDLLLLPGLLNALTPELRETFLLHYAQEFSVAEVACILNIPAGTVKSRLHTARNLLRDHLTERLPEQKALLATKGEFCP